MGVVLLRAGNPSRNKDQLRTNGHTLILLEVADDIVTKELHSADSVVTPVASLCTYALPRSSSVRALHDLFPGQSKIQRIISMTNSISQPAMKGSNRRSFIKGSAVAAGAATLGTGMFDKRVSAFQQEGPEEKSGRLTRGDAALLRFAAAAEILETDFWVQYNELGGVPNTSEVPGGSGNTPYTTAIQKLDMDMPQYIHDNTDDEFTHQNFLNAYLVSKGADPVSLEAFRTPNVPGSTATGSSAKLTNLTMLKVDTSWWTRYRIGDQNPDLNPSFVFPQAVPTLFEGQHTAIPRTNADTSDPNFLQAIANTAGFHFATIEQGGTSLYPAMAPRAKHPEVLRILISIGPTETMHSLTWQDKAGNALQVTAVDRVTGVSVTLPDLTRGQ